ncbi:hypothetical protein ACWDHW_13230 [Streptomyces melanosporofaciens]|uniref:hypothetical protein n=1 Tax=Streptomyces sp. NPDC021218 TaxID=3365119 RepID=UPI00379418B0
MKLPGFRSGSTGRPAQTRRRDADLSAKSTEEATVQACHEDFATGAEARAELDRAAKTKANRLGLGGKKAR